MPSIVSKDQIEQFNRSPRVDSLFPIEFSPGNSVEMFNGICSICGEDIDAKLLRDRLS